MTCHLRWYLPRRVILVQYEATISLEDVYGQMRDTEAMMHDGIPLTHVVIDLTRVEKWPPFSEIARFRSVDISSYRDKLGWTVIITSNKLLRFASSIFAPMFNTRQRMVTSLEEGIALLKELDASLAAEWQDTPPAP